MKKLLVLFVCIFVTVVSTQAQLFFNGNQLVESMREYDKFKQGISNYNSFDNGIFMGYVIGVCDVMHAKLPDGTIIGQVAEVVAKYLKEHPELWTRPAHELVRQAIIEAFGLTK